MTVGIMLVFIEAYFEGIGDMHFHSIKKTNLSLRCMSFSNKWHEIVQHFFMFGLRQCTRASKIFLKPEIFLTILVLNL